MVLLRIYGCESEEVEAIPTIKATKAAGKNDRLRKLGERTIISTLHKHRRIRVYAAYSPRPLPTVGRCTVSEDLAHMNVSVAAWIDTDV
jgi:hypothetical protein